MNRKSYETVTIDVKTVTFKALCIGFRGEDLWIPRSVLSDEANAYVETINHPEEDVDLEIETWLVKKHGLNDKE
jgi:hypothetical protein